MRRALWLLASLWVLGAGLVVALATRAARDVRLRGVENATHTADLPFMVPRFGVNAALLTRDAATHDAHLAAMHDLGVTWVRQHVDWGTIEPEPGVYDWAVTDALAAGLRAQPTLRWVAVLHNTPRWARDPRASDAASAPPQHPAHYARAAAAFAARYADVLAALEVWDEPNLTAAWGGLEPSPVVYAALLAATAPAVRAAGVPVHTAALAPTVETGPHNLSDILFLEALYALGAQPHFDAVAAKPYGFDHAPDERTVAANVLNASRVVRLRELMRAHGDGHKALWASAWGWNHLPQAWPGLPSIWGAVSAEQQAQFTLGLLDRAAREWPWMGGMILAHWQPDAPPDDPLWGFALLNPTGTPTALHQALASRPRPTGAAPPGLHPPDTPYAAYVGVWTFGPLGADVGWLHDSRLTFHFTGTDVALLLRQGDYVGTLYPTVNDAPPSALPRDANGRAYIVLTSPDRQPQVTLETLARGLPHRTHTVAATADRGWDQYALVGYAVAGPDVAQPYNQQIAVGWATALVGALALGMTLGTDAALRHTIVRRAQTVRMWLVQPLAGVAGASATIVLMLSVFVTWGQAAPALFRREPVALGLALATAGLWYLQPPLLVALVAAAFLVVLFVHRLVLGLALVLAWAPFVLFPVELARFAFPTAELLLLLCVVAWSTRGMLAWARATRTGTPLPTLVRPTIIDVLLLLWVTLGVLSMAWAAQRDLALTDVRVTLIEPLLFYAMIRTTPREPQQALTLVAGLVAGVVAASLISIGLLLDGQAIITAEGGARRLAGVYGSPNNLALMVGRALPFALALALIIRQRALRAGTLAALLILVVTVLLTQSAGALLLGVPASMAVVLLLTYGRRALLPLALLAGLAVVALLLLSDTPRVARLLTFSEGTNFFRLRVWQSALQLIADRPLTGVGMDQFLGAFRGHYIQPDAWQEPDLSHPHNLVLDAWTRLGVGGVLLLLGLLGAGVASWWRAWATRGEPAPHERAVLVGAAGAAANLVAHGLVDNSVFLPDLALVFVLLLALPMLLRPAPGARAVLHSGAQATGHATGG